MTTYESEVYDTICSNAIDRCRKIRFYYESIRGGNYCRKVEPYLIAINEKGNAYVTGYEYPSNERKTEQNNDGQGQWLLNKIDLNKCEVLDETFSTLKIPEQRIFGELPNVEVICRVSAEKMGIKWSALH